MACPVCGGMQYQRLNGDLVRCVGQRVIDVVPTGMGANGTGAPIPIFGPCTATYDLVEQARVAEQADYRRRRAAADEVALALAREQAEAASRAAIEAATPGFPVGETTGHDMAATLIRLVPHKTKSFLVADRALGLGAKAVDGWPFILGRERWTDDHVTFFKVLIVTVVGGCYRLDERRNDPSSGYAEVDLPGRDIRMALEAQRRSVSKEGRRGREQAPMLSAGEALAARRQVADWLSEDD
jgi:hypothetical protein